MIPVARIPWHQIPEGVRHHVVAKLVPLAVVGSITVGDRALVTCRVDVNRWGILRSARAVGPRASPEHTGRRREGNDVYRHVKIQCLSRLVG